MPRLLLILLFASLAAHEVSAQQVIVSSIHKDFEGSGGVSVGPDGNIYVANRGRFFNFTHDSEIWKITPDGKRTLFVDGIETATGNAWNSKGVMYQASILGHAVYEITLDGKITLFADQDDGIDTPLGIAVDSNDNVFVANCRPFSIVKVTPQRKASTFVIGDPRFKCPNGLVFDENDNLYVTTWNTNWVLKVAPNGFVSVIAILPDSDFHPLGGTSMLTYANGMLYVADFTTSQIYEVPLDDDINNFRSIAGRDARGNTDGPGSQALFTMPMGIAVSADERYLYINTSEDSGLDRSRLTEFELTPTTLRRIDLGTRGFTINPGLNGSWFNPETSGQGFFIDVFPDIPLVFLSWFTYDTTDTATDTAVVGNSNHRWITAQGAFSGNTAQLDVTLTTGGLFDDPTAVINSAPGAQGTIDLNFKDCASGTLVYNFPASGLFGTIPITRIAGDNVALCESLTP